VSQEQEEIGGPGNRPGRSTEVVNGDASVGEASRGAVRVEVADVGLPVGAGERAGAVVGAHVRRGVADDEERRGQRRRGGWARRGPPGDGSGEEEEEDSGGER
jgi:hypothetical protein